ncbi:MAG: phosphate signaling complex protein PhoU [Methylacidiphilaceae bacterium]|nr:phosphate signaling complex protein PhoU [Candidatus Methylacidiphilaceae bacterium]
MTSTASFELSRIRETLLLMASLAARHLRVALQALIERNDTLTEWVEKQDSEIDSLEVKVDDLVITYIATHSPVAIDCRFVLVASKISSDLERIGDQAVTIARLARRLNAAPPLKLLFDIPQMAMVAEEMYRDAIDCFIEAKAKEAIGIVKRDKEVDVLNKKLSEDLLQAMREHPGSIPQATSLLLISRAIERIADHAKNIAEEVYYLYRARDIRHRGRTESGRPLPENPEDSN